jgi:hypothetical protein
MAIQSKAQTESPNQTVPEEELITESVELNEEISIHIMNKINIYDFLNDVELSSFMLNDNQRKALIEHLKNTGNLIDLLELQSLVDFDYNTYLSLVKIIKIQSSSKIKTEHYLKIQHRSIHQNYLEEKAIGSPWGIYQQIQIQFTQGTKIGLAREFDVGENTKHGLLNSYDHYAWYVHHKTQKMEITVGHFQVFYGLGLLLGQGFSGAFGQGGINNIVQNRWKGIANQIEYNTLSGAYLQKRFLNFSFNIGISHQSVDSINSFGIHRLESQQNAKNKASEKLIIGAIDYTHRQFKSSVLYLLNQVNKEHSFSFSNQLFLGTSTLFSELAIQATDVAYSLGLSRLINKNLQLSLSFSSYNDGYKSVYASNTVQGITKNNKNGFVFHLTYQTPSKWNINLTHKAIIKNFTANKTLGTSSENSENIRLDRNINNQIRLSTNLYTRVREQEGNETSESTVRIREARTRIGIDHSLNDLFQQHLYYYRSQQHSHHSNAITYQIIYKSRWLKASYVLSLHEINKETPVYISTSSLIQGRITQAVYENGSMQQWAISTKINRIIVQVQLIQLNKVMTDVEERKLMLSLKYP